MHEIEKVLSQLPPELKKEVFDYAEFLLRKYQKKNRKKGFTFSWEADLLPFARGFSDSPVVGRFAGLSP